MIMRLSGKVAIITGASKGIGKAIAQRYAEEGAKVVLASRSSDLIKALAEEIEAKGGEALAVHTDVTKVDSVQGMVNATIKQFGHLDILVNNAGITRVQDSVELSQEDWRDAIETDLSGIFYCSQAAAREMIRQNEGGNILNITSAYGFAAAPRRAAYCASKAGANMLTRVLAVEWAKYKINVNAIAPGYLREGLTQLAIAQGILTNADIEAIERRTPQGRLGEIEDVLGLTVFIVSEEAQFMTGEIVTVDGGWVAYGYL
jgi:NAD(P)-dependent dehydrogenase (short-subunit alcohol dehydrogenase family)